MLNFLAHVTHNEISLMGVLAVSFTVVGIFLGIGAVRRILRDRRNNNS